MPLETLSPVRRSIAGLSRESLYKALSQTGNPSFETVRAVLQALGLQLSVKRADKPAA